MKSVLVSIPAKNEAAAIAAIIQKIKAVMNQTKISYALQVVDDGSTDNTGKIAAAHGATVITHPYTYGLAETFRTEIKAFLESVHIDADGQYLPEEIPLLLREIVRGVELVLGNRFMLATPPIPWLKRWGNHAFSRVISHIIRRRIGDCQTGFRAFTRDVAESIQIISTHTYTQEQIIRAAREKFRIKEVPIHFLPRASGESRLLTNPFEYAIKAWINILRIYRDYEPLKFFGSMGLCFIAAGVFIGGYLVYLFLTTGHVGHLPATILTMLLIVVGIQILILAFIADMNRK